MKAPGKAGPLRTGKQRLTRRRPGGLWTLLFAAGFLSGPAWSDTRQNQIPDETVPPKMGMIQRELMQETARKNQERYRLRVVVPETAVASRPVDDQVQAGKDIPDYSPPGFASQNSVLVLLALLAAGGFALKKFAPELTESLAGPRAGPAPLPAVAADLSAKVRGEEEAFAKFLAEFRVSAAGVSTPAPGNYLVAAKGRLAALQTKLGEITAATDPTGRRSKLDHCRDQVRTLAADAADWPAVWQLATGLEGLLKQVADNANNFTSSTLRTLNAGAALIADLLRSDRPASAAASPAIRLLVVDDDLISRNALAFALKRTFDPPALAAGGREALALVNAQTYDLIFLDVQMPEIDGFELCQRIHQTGLNRATPVVFVTCYDDFAAREKSLQVGAMDLVGKPFLTFEIIVKALTLIWRHRHEQGRHPTVTPVQKPVPASRTPAVEIRRPAAPAMELPAKTEVAGPAAEENLQAFSEHVSTNLAALRRLLQDIIRVSDEPACHELLVDFYLLIHALTGNADVAPLRPALQLSTSLEALTKKLLEKPDGRTPSTFNTIYTALELIDELCARALPPDFATNPAIRLLVAATDPVTGRVIAGALQTAFTRPEMVADAAAALASAREKTYDAIFLDVRLPDMSGFELCVQIGKTAGNRATPVIFIAGTDDYSLRAQAVGCGGSDLIAKPFLPLEINVKALTFALNRRLQGWPQKKR